MAIASGRGKSNDDREDSDLEKNLERRGVGALGKMRGRREAGLSASDCILHMIINWKSSNLYSVKVQEPEFERTSRGKLKY